MSDFFYLSEEQFNRIKKYFPYPHGKPRVNDVSVISRTTPHLWKMLPQGRIAQKPKIVPHQDHFLI